MVPHADSVHLGGQQVGENESVGAGKDVFENSAKVADIPAQVSSTTVVSEHDHDNEHYTRSSQEIFDEKNRADTPMMEIDPQIDIDVVFAPTFTDEERLEVHLLTKPTNSLSDEVREIIFIFTCYTDKIKAHPRTIPVPLVTPGQGHPQHCDRCVQCMAASARLINKHHQICYRHATQLVADVGRFGGWLATATRQAIYTRRVWSSNDY
jgi:hypothetical protein